MASHRPYRPALGVDVAFAELRKGAGVIYDQQVVAARETRIQEIADLLNIDSH